MNYCTLGFNGERIDPVSGTTHLGNGYRTYDPILMRFNCPDSMGPFGAGGINPYAYCDGDPFNRADPSGHTSTGQWIGMGVSLVFGFTLGILTAGAAMPAVLSLMAIVAGDAVIGVETELVAAAVDGQRVNWTSLGIAAGGAAVASLLGFGASRLISKAGHFVGDWQYRLRHAGSCLSTSKRASLDVGSSAQVRKLLQLNRETRLFSPRESVAYEYQEIASSENVYKLEFHPQHVGKYIATNLTETKGIYPEGVFSFVIRADRKDDVLIGKVPNIPGRSLSPTEIAGHTSMTRDIPGSDPVDVYYAGEITFGHGNLIRWNNTSGHYKPSATWAGRNVEPGVKKLLPMSKFVEDFF